MATFGQLSTDPKQAQLLPLGAPEPTGGAFFGPLYYRDYLEYGESWRTNIVPYIGIWPSKRGFVHRQDNWLFGDTELDFREYW